MWSVARRPIWIAGHLIAASAVVAFVLLGLWQLDRHGERRDLNEAVSAAADLPLVDISGPLDITPDEYRTVRVTGTYAVGADILIRNRSLDGIAGVHLLTPMNIDGGVSVLVRRGFVSNFERDDLPAPPTGEVTIVGRIRASESANRLTGFGWREPTVDSPAVAGWVDVAAIDANVSSALAFAPEPRFVDLIESSPADSDRLGVLPPPDLGSGPHLSYAGQWFLFALVVLIGYPAILRRAAHTDGRGQADEPANDSTSVSNANR